jgi:hypothetical protein
MGGAPVESTAIRKVVSVVTAPAGKSNDAPLASVTVPPSAPMTGGGGGEGGGGGGGGGGCGLFDVGGGVVAPPPALPPQPASATNKLNTHRIELRCDRMTPALLLSVGSTRQTEGNQLTILSPSVGLT